MSASRIATYRLQLHEDFRFEHAAAVAGYLTSLGISHLYLSPIMQARSGSRHGYDVIDPERINDDLGGIEGLRALAAVWPGEVIIDIVPNHMAVTDPGNRWWWDVLKHGPGSEFVEFFDIDWDPTEDRLKRSILIPVLGDHYGRVLERGELQLAMEGDEPVVRYYEHILPLAPSTRPHDIEAVNKDHDRIHEILEAQHYRLAHWKAAGRDLNYRRFFAINDLAALRVDRVEVFEVTHRVIFDLMEEGLVHGLRVDHIDGLRYPREYLQRLQQDNDRYVIVEKILEGGERLRSNWPVQGTTGYEFISYVDGLFVDPEAEKPLTDLYERFTGIELDLHSMATEAKLHIMDTELASDIERLTELLVAVCEDQRRYRDFTRPELRQTIREVIASLGVYRTYADARDASIDEEDALVIERAIGDALDRRPDLDPDLFELLRDVLLLRISGEEEAALAMRFQQASGPVMAKGIEDTLFYRYNRFVALNEVGGSPDRFGSSVDDFHRHNATTQSLWPETMLAGSTHDTKRSEDARARLALLSEIPDGWAAAITRWSEHNRVHRQGEWPDRNLEYLLYQTLVGTWPVTSERVISYMTKAAKEAKVHTSWIAPDERFDEALSGFVESIFADESFLTDVEAFVAPLIVPGYVNSLAQTLLRLTSPGVPDLYQGSEIWDLSLVDPDNRRPVDYVARERLMAEVRSMDGRSAWSQPSSGAPKMFLIHQALATRARHGAEFAASGSYTPLFATGVRANNVIAFARGANVVSVAPRLGFSLGGRWDDTTLALPPGEWVNVLTGEKLDGAVRVSALLARFPVALCERVDR